MENLFDCLCSLMLEDSNRQRFLQGEGLQLMNLMLREKKKSRSGALKVLSQDGLAGMGETQYGGSQASNSQRKKRKKKRRTTVIIEEGVDRLARRKQRLDNHRAPPIRCCTVQYHTIPSAI